MGASNDDLFDQVIRALNELFGDTSVSKAQARDNLEAVKEEIDIMLDSLEA